MSDHAADFSFAAYAARIIAVGNGNTIGKSDHAANIVIAAYAARIIAVGNETIIIIKLIIIVISDHAANIVTTFNIRLY